LALGEFMALKEKDELADPNGASGRAGVEKPLGVLIEAESPLVDRL
jgi:hypothetical protein